MIFQYLRRRSFKGFLIQLRSNDTPFHPFWSHYLRMLPHKLHIWGKIVFEKFFLKINQFKNVTPSPQELWCELMWTNFNLYHLIMLPQKWQISCPSIFLRWVLNDILIIFTSVTRLSLPTVAPPPGGHNVINLNLHTPGCFHIR